jgi:hypothetical protein
MPQLLRNSGPSREYLDGLRAFQERADKLTAPRSRGVPAAADAKGTLSSHQRQVLDRLRAYRPELAESLEQALLDLEAGGRRTYVGPAGEAREVMRAAIHLLAEDGPVKLQTWYKGDEHGNPTQSERVRYAVAQKGRAEGEALSSAELVEEKIGALGRNVYRRASRAFHVGTQQREVRTILSYVFVVLDEVLPG